MSDPQAAADAAATTAGADDMEKMRAEMALLRSRAEKAEKKNETWDTLQRQEISSLREEVDGFVTQLGEEFPERKVGMLPIANWAKTCHEQSDPEHQLPLTYVLSCASAKVKRTLEQASQKAADAEALGTAMKENETLKDQVGKLQKRETDLEAHIRDMDARNSELDKVLRQHNLTTAKFDFSKVSSREAGASDAAAPAASQSVDEAVAKANPVAAAAASNDASLMSFLLAGGSGAARFMPTSSSGHSLLSAVAPQ